MTCRHCAASVEAQIEDRDSLFDGLRLWNMLTAPDPVLARLALDPGDWGQWLLDLPEDWPVPTDPQQRNYYDYRATPIEATWRSGGAQDALRGIRDWCKERGVAFGVVIWPLLQGLEGSATYPFETLHRVVREFGETESIAVLDLLPNFVGRDSRSLWVDPSDMHANEVAHELAADPIAEFVKTRLTVQ